MTRLSITAAALAMLCGPTIAHELQGFQEPLIVAPPFGSDCGNGPLGGCLPVVDPIVMPEPIAAPAPVPARSN